MPSQKTWTLEIGFQLRIKIVPKFIYSEKERRAQKYDEISKSYNDNTSSSKKILRFRHNFLVWLKLFTTEYHSFNNTFLVPEELPIPIVWLHDYHLMLGIIHILRNLTFILFGPPLPSIFKMENQFMIKFGLFEKHT